MLVIYWASTVVHGNASPDCQEACVVGTQVCIDSEFKTWL